MTVLGKVPRSSRTAGAPWGLLLTFLSQKYPPPEALNLFWRTDCHDA
jgi:hypothetical protein